MTPTQRTIRELKNLGRRCGIVERFISQAGPHGRRLDLFSIIDIISLDPQRGVVGIQSCGQAFSEHYRKITVDEAENAIEWLQTPGAQLELWAWRKVKVKRGGKAMHWRPRVHVFSLDDFA